MVGFLAFSRAAAEVWQISSYDAEKESAWMSSIQLFADFMDESNEHEYFFRIKTKKYLSKLNNRSQIWVGVIMLESIFTEHSFKEF